MVFYKENPRESVGKPIISKRNQQGWWTLTKEKWRVPIDQTLSSRKCSFTAVLCTYTHIVIGRIQ